MGGRDGTVRWEGNMGRMEGRKTKMGNVIKKGKDELG